MTPLTQTLGLDTSRLRRRTAAFVELTKPRLVSMILLTTTVGFYLGSWPTVDYGLLLHTLLGTGLAGGGTLALNQLMERHADALMERTRTRPLPAGRLQPADALVFGTLLTVAGLVYLLLVVDPLSALVTAAISASYLFAYTPLKQKTTLCSIAGAVPGALPPVVGWTAASGTLGIEAAILFTIMFLWQMPHSLAIAWLYREDYARAGFRLLPVIEPDGKSTGRQVVTHCLALLAVGLLPTLVGMAGTRYFVIAFGLGCLFLWYGMRLARTRSRESARTLMFASLVYLPILLTAMALDKLPGNAMHPTFPASAVHGDHRSG